MIYDERGTNVTGCCAPVALVATNGPDNIIELIDMVESAVGGSRRMVKPHHDRFGVHNGGVQLAAAFDDVQRHDCPTNQTIVTDPDAVADYVAGKDAEHRVAAEWSPVDEAVRRPSTASRSGAGRDLSQVAASRADSLFTGSQGFGRAGRGGAMAVPRTTRWPLDPHTVAKHEILRRYLGAWFPILTHAGFHRRVIFLDGFAGPGIYSAGEKGSPLIALETLVEHQMFSKLERTEFVLFLVEADPERFASLQEQVADYWARLPGGQPDNVRVEMVNGEFSEVADELLSSLEESGNNLAPTFAFVDPFGFKGVPFSIFQRIARYPRCEVFFNFMYDSLNRWITHPQDSIHVHLTDLFGCTEYRGAAGREPADRKAFLHELYERQLVKVAGLQYVQSFEMIGMSGHTTYSLFYGTKSLVGLKVMKDAMWKLDPIEGGRFSDRLAGVDVLFEPEPDLYPLRQAILERFAGTDVAVPAIEKFVLAHTPYSASHYKKGVLAELQREGAIEIVSGQKKRNTFPDAVVVRFPTIT